MLGEWTKLQQLEVAFVAGDEPLSMVDEARGAPPADAASTFAFSSAATAKASWRLGFFDLGLVEAHLRRWPVTAMIGRIDQQGD